MLYWVVKDKTNQRIGHILGGRPITVKKHLEYVRAKRGIDTRTAVANKRLARIPQIQPQLEGVA